MAEPIDTREHDGRNEGAQAMLRRLRSSSDGLTSLDAARRLDRFGRNELTRRAHATWVRELVRQLVHPLAVLLWAAAGLAFIAGTSTIGIAVIFVILLNAAFAFVQERQAERAVEALAAFLPPRATVLRDHRRTIVDAAELVPGDILVIVEGDRISADSRLLDGALEVDMAALTGESASVEREAGGDGAARTPLEANDLVFSGTVCTSGEAHALVFATGMHTELGRIAALSERVDVGESPLEKQIRRLAWVIALVAVGLALAFIPIATLGAGLSLDDSLTLAIGLLVGNVPEGMLPVITLALAVAVRDLARQGALVKRLSAVETLGSTTVICTDKTGTLTENRMQVVGYWTPEAGEIDPEGLSPGDRRLASLLSSMTACCDAELASAGGEAIGDATELAMLEAAARLGMPVDPAARTANRLRLFRFNPVRKTMSTISDEGGEPAIAVKGAPESVLACCASDVGRPLDREAVMRVVNAYAGRGLRVLAVARRPLGAGEDPDQITRDDTEERLTLLGLVALHDPPRATVKDAVAQCRAAGIRIHVVTGDNGLTARAIAREVGIADEHTRVIDGPELDAMDDDHLYDLLASRAGLIFSRSSPEAKLRIADHLESLGEVVAMTGDGVNDAPALRAADIGVAMGASGTEVAREAATIVLTDDDFADIVAAIRGGRRVYANIRKFLFYILTHTTPEVVPYVAYGLAGGSLPLPLTIMQVLAIDIGTEVFPALSLGREPAEPGVMHLPPRSPHEHVINARMLGRAWLYLGMIAAALTMGMFLYVLNRAGWNPGDPTGPGTPLHEDYLRATTMTFLSIVACQVGTAFAARTEHASLREIGFFSNPALLRGVAFAIVLALAIAYVPPLQSLIGTATPKPEELVMILPFPFIIFGADAARRRLARRRFAVHEAAASAGVA